MVDTWKNRLIFGDNLDIMREHIPDESIDLIYLDPPFNSKASYNVLFGEANGSRSAAQITAFEDTWRWDLRSEEAYREIIHDAPKRLIDLLQSLRSLLGQNDLMAYLVMMAIRLTEMHRVLKQSGNIFLHCDPTASHYLKLVMDAIFDITNFRNEIVWSYQRWTGVTTSFQRMHDIILFYSKNRSQMVFNTQYESYSAKSKHEAKRVSVAENGKVVSQSYTDDRSRKKAMRDVWEISYLNSQAKERLGYPTQKPEALLERIIQSGSNEGDIVLDPFCGCGTTVAVAERLERRWIGIDITHLAITLMKRRLEDAFGGNLSAYEVIGDQTDVLGAKSLAEQDRYQFEWWVLGRLSARPARDKKKGADTGVDGYLYFVDDNSGIAKKIVLQVKSGHVTRSQIATLKGDMEREKAAIAGFITLNESTRPMREEAATAGFYEPALYPGMRFPRLQILTIGELLSGKQLDYPRVAPEVTFKKAEKKGKETKQLKIEGDKS